MKNRKGHIADVWDVRWRWGMALLVVALFLAVASHAQESTAPVSFSVGDDGRARIEVPSAADRYHVLYYRSDPDDAATESPVALHMGADGGVTLTEPLGVGAGGAYRVATYRKNAPGDTDGDGTDDLAELARADKTARAPFNDGVPFDKEDGALAIPDMATFQELSFQGIPWEPHLRGLEYIKLIFEYDGIVQYDESGTLGPGNIPLRVYYVNSNTYQHHLRFKEAILGAEYAYSSSSTGVMVYHPYVRAPNGEVGVFRYNHYFPRAYSHFENVEKFHEMMAADMPFLRGNLVYGPLPTGLESYKKQKAKYDASRVAVMLDGDLAQSVFEPVNVAVGFGLLRVLAPGERPTFRDIAILRTLPNDLPAVGGVISLMPQTPLSHVNLRAVQDGAPNAYIGNALEDATISALIGRYVRFEVKAGTKARRTHYTIREATAEEVAAHHAARRPAGAQTPSRNLSVTTYKDLDDIAFAGSDAFGVKAANVATLRTFGFADGTVPDGFALPFYFYDAFMTHNGFYADVDELLADTDFQADIATRDAELKKLRRRIRNGTVPDWMADDLAALQAEFPAGTSIRCRSSTNNEDLPDFSGAGLYDSYTHHPSEGHLSKSVKQVFASLWNLRAFEEREFYRIDHKAAAMGVLMHPNYSDEQANGVAVSDDPFYGTEDRFYVNAQVGEDLVTNPSSASVPEELLLGVGETFTTTLVQPSNLVADDARVLTEAHIATLQAALRTIHQRFLTLYEVAEDEEFAMEIEFKITADDTFAVKQARPWVY